MGEVRNGDHKVRKHLFSEIIMAVRPFFTRIFFQELFGLKGSKNSLKISSGAQSENLEPFFTIQEFFSKNIPGLYAAYVYPFWVVSL